METSLVHCLWHCYSCYALVNNTGNELVIFPGIALKTDNKTIILFIPNIAYVTAWKELGYTCPTSWNVHHNFNIAPE